MVVAGGALGGAGRPGVNTLLPLLGAETCGGFTTFSTFGHGAVRLAEMGSCRTVITNAAAGPALGMPAAHAGWYPAQAVRS